MHQVLGQIIAALVGASVALSVVWLTHRATLARSFQERRLNKLEELLDAVLKFSQQTQRLYDIALDVQVCSDPDEFDSRLRELREQRLDTHSRIRLLSAVYFPEMQKIIDGMWQGIVDMYKQALRAGGGPKFSELELQEAFLATRNGSAQMRRMCIHEANRLLSQKSTIPTNEA